ncbi:MAG: cation diffusion facilitator family transporter [Cyclonatronaceae bacterium]
MKNRKSDLSRKAITISLIVSFFSFTAKAAGYLLTGSNTVLSDLAESVVHLLAVSFAMYGVFLRSKPADEKHSYGHERISLLTVGAEGVVIVLAGLTIIYQSVKNLLFGLEITRIYEGMAFMTAAALINLVLGLYLVRTGKKERNMIVYSNGKHTLTDVYTSGGVVLTLLLISITGLVILDAIVAVAVAIFIMYEGKKLVSYSLDGIMDSVDPEADLIIRNILNGDDIPGHIKDWHNLRHRTTGSVTWIELHLLFEKDIDLQTAHDEATALEKKLMSAIQGDVIVTIHLEPEETHAKSHQVLKGIQGNPDLENFF